MKKKLKNVVLILCMLLAMAVMFGATASAAAKPKLSASKKTLYVGGTKAKSQFVLTLKNNKKTVKWSTSNKKVTAISGKGSKVTITAKKKGTATIKAKVGKKTYKCKITVRQYVTSLKLNKTSVSLKKGKTYQLKTTVKPSNANTKTVTWSSSDKKVATVSSKGKITAKGTGVALISCKAKDGSGKEVMCRVVVPWDAASAKPVSAMQLRTRQTVAAGLNADNMKHTDGEICHVIDGIVWYVIPAAIPSVAAQPSVPIVYTWDKELSHSGVYFGCWTALTGYEVPVDSSALTWTVDKPDFIQVIPSAFDPRLGGCYFKIKPLKGDGFAHITFKYKGKSFKVKVWVTSIHSVYNGKIGTPSHTDIQAEYKRLTGLKLWS